VTEIRTDPLTLDRVIVVPGRSARPNEHAAPPPLNPAAPDCPFCEGNESRTPPEVAVVGRPGRRPNERGWDVRVIPNRFPTVTTDPPGETESPDADRLRRAPAFGFHEVLIESASHSPLFPYLSTEQAVRVLRMARDRVRALEGRSGVGSLTLFENAGPESGGSLWHPHAQIVSTAGASPSLEREFAGIERLRASTQGRCVLETLQEEETGDRSRVVFESRDFVGFAPFASAYPYEVRVVPKRHSPSFAEATDGEVDDLAERLPAVLRALLAVIPGASYNYLLRVPSRDRPERQGYHWHLDIYPRLVRPDGFDLGSGFHVNTVLPEEAARILREQLSAKS
jgi:UDPglucose--hexose-1-phosphate uridylyltransferase